MNFSKLFVVLLTLVVPLQRDLAAQDFGDSSDKQALDIQPSDVIRWEGAQATAYSDGRIVAGLRLTTLQNFSIYKKRLVIEGPKGMMPTFLTQATARLQADPMGEGQVEVFDGGDFEIQFKDDHRFTEKTLKVRITSLGCTQKICLFPYTQELQIPVFAETLVASVDPSTDAAAQGAAALTDLSSPEDLVPAASSTSPPSSLSLEEDYAEKLKTGSLAFWLVLVVSFLGGVATNLTPCVFPMIPITLRLLARQGQSPVVGALYYAAGIVLTYSCLGIVASLSGGFFGSLLAHPAVNIAFGMLFLFLGITMLGFGNFSGMQNLGAQLGSGRASHVNAFGMGAGAGLVAAPCTGPIMGALLAYASRQQSSAQALALFVVYSIGFAIPYVGLGMVAHKVSAFKLSPKVQVAVKIIFAAAMVGLAAYYLKNPAYHTLLSLQGQWWWLSLSLLSFGIILISIVLRSSHLMLTKTTHLLPSLILGLSFFSSIQWATGADLKSELRWIKNETEANEIAQKTLRPILVDGWADWCVACKKLDQVTFHDPRILEELGEHWVLLKLDLTELNDANDALAEKYGMQGLPTLVMIPSDGNRGRSKSQVGFITAERLLGELQTFRKK